MKQPERVSRQRFAQLGSLARTVNIPLILMATGGVSAQHRLDTTTPTGDPAREPSGRVYGITAMVVGGEKPPVLPLAVTLGPVDRADVFVGDHVTFEVTLRNTGKSDLPIPWSVTPSDTFPERDLRLQISLVAVDDASVEYPQDAGVNLYGGGDHPESLLLLKPGETATIRIRGGLRPNTTTDREAAFLKLLPRAMRLRALVRLTTAPAHWAAPIMSTGDAPRVVVRLPVQ